MFDLCQMCQDARCRIPHSTGLLYNLMNRELEFFALPVRLHDVMLKQRFVKWFENNAVLVFCRSWLHHAVHVFRNLELSQKSKWIRILAFALIGILVSMSFINLWIVKSTQKLVYRDVAVIPHRQVVLVPGAFVYESGRPSDILKDRLACALSLYRADKVDRILVSGDHQHSDYDEVNAMGRWLLDRGVRIEDLFLDHAGLRTLDTMARAASVFNVKSATVCTQEFHLSRSIYSARNKGIDALGLVADQRRYKGQVLNHGREFLARSVSFLDTQLINRSPAFEGDPIPITGDSRKSHDGGLTGSPRANTP